MNAILNTNFPNLTVFVERYKPFSDLISGAAEEDISNFIHNCQDMEMEGRCPWCRYWATTGFNLTGQSGPGYIWTPKLRYRYKDSFYPGYSICYPRTWPWDSDWNVPRRLCSTQCWFGRSDKWTWVPRQDRSAGSKSRFESSDQQRLWRDWTSTRYRHWDHFRFRLVFNTAFLLAQILAPGSRSMFWKRWKVETLNYFKKVMEETKGELSKRIEKSSQRLELLIEYAELR